MVSNLTLTSTTPNVLGMFTTIESLGALPSAGIRMFNPLRQMVVPAITVPAGNTVTVVDMVSLALFSSTAAPLNIFNV